MADARALLRAKRQEARISHPLALYNTAGQLRCAICGTTVKYASAWEGHLGSKAHRTNVARIKEEERQKEQEKEKEEEEEEEEQHRRAAEAAQASSHKRKVDDDSDSEADPKKPKLDAGSKFPADFFSDPSRALALGSDSDNEQEEEEGGVLRPAHSAIDLEYQRFQEELEKVPDFRETYERATVVAEPVLAQEAPEGFPVTESSAEAAGKEQQAELTEEEKHQLREADEKELIMDRLLEEERAQEEADMKVQMMKNRLEAFKKQREAARMAKNASW